jgi:hypothetical protein
LNKKRRNVSITDYLRNQRIRRRRRRIRRRRRRRRRMRWFISWIVMFSRV